MSLASEQQILDGEDQSQVICNDCGATLEQYRQGQTCNVSLDDWCAGFNWVEKTLGNDHN